MAASIQVITIPADDIDRAADFYARQADFRLDVDDFPASDFRVMQLARPARPSPCSWDQAAALPGQQDRARSGAQCQPAGCVLLDHHSG